MYMYIMCVVVDDTIIHVSGVADENSRRVSLAEPDSPRLSQGSLREAGSARPSSRLHSL